MHFRQAQAVLGRLGEGYPHDAQTRIDKLTRFITVFAHNPLRDVVDGKIDRFVRKPGDDRTKFRRTSLSESEIRRALEKQKAAHLRRGDTVVPEVTDERVREVENAQRTSLEEWVSYLVANDTDPVNPTYPMWFKYLMLKSVMEATNRGTLRTPTTYAPYAPLDQGALGKTLDIARELETPGSARKMLARRRKAAEREHFALPNNYEVMLAEHDLVGLYLHEYRLNEELRRRRLESAEGTFEWKEYKGKAGAQRVVADLHEAGSTWCLAGETVAENYLVRRRGSLHVLYAGPAHVKIGIYIPKEGSWEVRGGSTDQHVALDGRVIEAVRIYANEHFNDTSNAKAIEQKLRDTAVLTDIQEGMSNGQIALLERSPDGRTKLKELLTALYELDRPLATFGYGRDKQIDALQRRREPMRSRDLCIILECDETDIATKPSEITAAAKVYNGPLVDKSGKPYPDFFRKYPQLQHAWTNFPEGRVQMRPVKLANQTPEAMRKSITDAGMSIFGYADKMLETLPNEKNLEGEYEAVIVSNAQLGFPEGAKFKVTKDRAQSLGLMRAPAKLAAQMREQFADQPDGYLIMGMEPIIVDGSARVFVLSAGGGRLELHNCHGLDGHEWGGSLQFVFLRRKLAPPAPAASSWRR